MEIFIYKLLANDTYTILGFTDGATIPAILQIPDEYEGKPITVIGDYAFSQYHTPDTVILGNNIRKIGNSAFENCVNLKSVNLSKVRSIGDSAFKNTSIKIIVFPESLKEVGDDAFGDCSNLEKVLLNSTVKFKSSVFSNCSSINYFDVPNLDLLIKSKFKDPASNPLFYTKKIFVNNTEIKEIAIDGLESTYSYVNCEFETIEVINERINEMALYGAKCKKIIFRKSLSFSFEHQFLETFKAEEIVFQDIRYSLPEFTNEILEDIGIIDNYDATLPF